LRSISSAIAEFSASLTVISTSLLDVLASLVPVIRMAAAMAGDPDLMLVFSLGSRFPFLEDGAAEDTWRTELSRR